ncbi:MAG: TIGR03016 family PEP-CTERM system-associated outer membrane protein [Rhodospirillales bacterium]
MPASALAQNWDITPRIGVRETFTDNVDLATESGNRRSDFVTSVAPGLSLRGSGARVQAGLDAQLEYRYYLNSSDRNRDNFIPDIAGFGRVELWEDRFFIDGRAAISRLTTDATIGGFGGDIGSGFGSPATRDLGTTEVRSFSIAPSFIHRFGSFGTFNARADYGLVDTDDEQFGSSQTFSQALQLQSGRQFSQTLWTVAAFHTQTMRDDEFGDEEETRGTVNGTYVLTDQLALLATLGWQDVTDDTFAGENDGLIWNVGFTYRPSVRTSVKATYGREYANDSLTFSGTYAPTSRTQFSADYYETIQNSQQLVLRDLLFLGVSQTGLLVDTRTGLPFNFGGELFGFQSVSFRQKRFSAAAATTQGRSNFRVNAYLEKRESAFINSDQTVYGVGANFGRTLTRQATGNVGVNLSRTDYGTGDGREDDFIALSAGLSYFLFRDVQANLTYFHTQRLSNLEGQDITENAVSVSLSKTF